MEQKKSIKKLSILHNIFNKNQNLFTVLISSSKKNLYTSHMGKILRILTLRFISKYLFIKMT